MSEDRTRLDNLAELNVMYENTLSNKNVAPVVTNQVADNNGNNNSKDNNTDHLQQKLKVKVRQHLKVMRITCHPQLLQTNVHIFEEVLLHKEDVDIWLYQEDVEVFLFVVVQLLKVGDMGVLVSKTEKFVLHCQIGRKLKKNKYNLLTSIFCNKPFRKVYVR